MVVVSFITLVSGGPVEKRDFTALGGAIFWEFTVVLILLGILAITSGITLLRGKVWAAKTAIICGWGYIFVVMLDLGHVFPITPDPIPVLLGIIEILDAILAIYVIALCHRALGHI